MLMEIIKAIVTWAQENFSKPKPSEPTKVKEDLNSEGLNKAEAYKAKKATKLSEPTQGSPQAVTRGASLRAKNDSKRLKTELRQLRTKNEALYWLVIDLADWVKEEIGENLVITCILRTKEEQDRIYRGTSRGSRKYDENPWISPHQVWTAVDVRTWHFTPKEVNKIRDYLNNKYNSTNYYNFTAMYHEVTNSKGESLGKHFHINYVKK